MKRNRSCLLSPYEGTISNSYKGIGQKFFFVFTVERFSNIRRAFLCLPRLTLVEKSLQVLVNSIVSTFQHTAPCSGGADEGEERGTQSQGFPAREIKHNNKHSVTRMEDFLLFHIVGCLIPWRLWRGGGLVTIPISEHRVCCLCGELCVGIFLKSVIVFP